MAKSISVYLDEKELAVLDRLARGERRSRSGMLGEIIRRYSRIANSHGRIPQSLIREFSDDQLSAFLEEDRLSPKERAAWHKRLGLS